MPEITRLIGDSDWIELEFLEREATPEPAMKLGIRLHLAGLSLSDPVSILDTLGVDRHRTTVHTWVKKADLQPTGGADPDHVAVDETVIQLDDQRYWLYAAVDPDTNRILHMKLFPATDLGLTHVFLRKLREKHDINDATFLIDDADQLEEALSRLGLQFHVHRHGNRNSVERVFLEVKRQTPSFSNTFRNVDQRQQNPGSKPSLSGGIGAKVTRCLRPTHYF